MNERIDEMAIRALIDERVAAMRHKDAARAIATLAPDIVAFELARRPISSPSLKRANAAWGRPRARG